MNTNERFSFEEFLEPTADLRFASGARLKEHLVKHVLKGRKERWHQVLDATLLARARNERSRRQWGRNCRRLAEAYEGFLSTTVLDACSRGQCHRHYAKYHHADILTRGDVKSLEISCWDLESRTFLVAASNVLSSEEVTPYRIRTGYRIHEKVGEAAFLRKVRENSRTRRNSLCFVLVADHSNSPDELETTGNAEQ